MTINFSVQNCLTSYRSNALIVQTGPDGQNITPLSFHMSLVQPKLGFPRIVRFCTQSSSSYNAGRQKRYNVIACVNDVICQCL